MSAFNAALSGPMGSTIAILAMALATYLCRASGVILMSRVSLTPRVERALRALPGSIVVSAILPLAFDGGFNAVLTLAVTVLVMKAARFELFALIAGLATITAARAIGL